MAEPQHQAGEVHRDAESRILPTLSKLQVPPARSSKVTMNMRQPKTCLILAVSLLLGPVGPFGCGFGTAPDNPRQSEPPAEPRPRAGVDSHLSRNRYDLERDEERGGHTLKKHVARTDDQLRERLRHEHNISAASAWTDRETAETVVAEALAAERGRVENWMRRGYPRANLALDYDAGRAIGRSLRRGDDSAVNCTSAVIVLRADGPDSFYVLTAYPEARE